MFNALPGCLQRALPQVVYICEELGIPTGQLLERGGRPTREEHGYLPVKPDSLVCIGAKLLCQNLGLRLEIGRSKFRIGMPGRHYGIKISLGTLQISSPAEHKRWVQMVRRRFWKPIFSYVSLL